MSIAQVKPAQKLIARIGEIVDQCDLELLALYESLDEAVKWGGTFEACADARDALLHKLAPLLRQLRTETALGPCGGAQDAANTR